MDSTEVSGTSDSGSIPDKTTIFKFATMKFEASVNIMPQKALLDPQGKAVTGTMKNIGLDMVSGVRIGKHIKFELEADGMDEANSLVKQACEKLLANLIMESYEFTVKPL